MLSFTGREVVCLEQEGKKRLQNCYGQMDDLEKSSRKKKRKSGERKNTKGKKNLL